MKNTFAILTIMLSMSFLNIYGQCSGTAINAFKATSIGIVIYSNDIETIWNALRLGNYSKKEGDTVSIFLLGKGVELDSIVKKDKNIKDQSDEFLSNGGIILGCGTCLQSRKNNAPQVCKFSSLKDLYKLIRTNKIVLTF